MELADDPIISTTMDEFSKELTNEVMSLYLRISDYLPEKFRNDIHTCVYRDMLWDILFDLYYDPFIDNMEMRFQRCFDENYKEFKEKFIIGNSTKWDVKFENRVRKCMKIMLVHLNVKGRGDIGEKNE